MSSEEDLDLVAAGCSAILGFRVVHGREGQGLPKLTIRNLFHCTYMDTLPALEYVPQKDVFDIHVKSIIGSTTTVQVTGAHSIAEVKAAVEMKANIPARDQQLTFKSRRLEDHHTISYLGIPPSGTIFLLVRARGGGSDLQLDAKDLDPTFDYDFTNESNDGKTYMRGGKEYKRPYGWKRIAVKVLGVYESNTWLGPNGKRTEQAQGEWPVSYHGTNFQSASIIIGNGYKIGPREKFGKAVYTSPDLDMVARHYAVQFGLKENWWNVVLQNRVNPDPGHFTIIPASQTGVGAEYWLSTKDDVERGVHDVRPYGMLFKRAGGTCCLI